jgi:hypothetical protein
MRYGPAGLLLACALVAVPALAGTDDHVESYFVSYGNFGPEPSPVTPVAPPRITRRFYEHAFFTPEPNYQQAGYMCTGLVSVYRKGGVKHLHRGSYCVR